MAQEHGRDCIDLIKFESSYGTAPGGNYVRVPFINSSFGKSREFIPDDQLIGTGAEALTPEIDVLALAGNHVVPIDLRCFAWWLKLALGAATTTGSGPYTHTFKSNATSILSLAHERKRLNGGKYFLNKGVIMESMSIPLARTGWANATLQLRGQDQARADSTGGGTPTTPTPRRFVNRVMSIKKDGSTLAKVLSGNINIALNPQEIPELRADGLIGGFDQGDVVVTGELAMKFDAMTMLDLADAQTALALEVAWTIDADNSLTLTLPCVRLQPGDVEVASRNASQASYKFRAEKDASETCTIKAVLKNDVSAY